MEWQQDLKDPKEFLETVKVDLFTDEVFVFTPKGDVKSLPRGATPVDFAYAIHSDVGAAAASGAKVNGKIVPLRYKLKNGDTVEILTSPHAHPSKDWLTFVKTSRAQARIRQFIRQAEHRRSLEIGQEVAERELRRFGLSLSQAAEGRGARQGRRRRSATASTTTCWRPSATARSSPRPAAAPARARGEAGRRPAGARRHRAGSPSSSARWRGARPSGVRISGIDDVLVRFGRCCNPVPGDPIVGFITRGRGVTVHTARCEKALAIDPGGAST